MKFLHRILIFRRRIYWWSSVSLFRDEAIGTHFVDLDAISEMEGGCGREGMFSSRPIYLKSHLHEMPKFFESSYKFKGRNATTVHANMQVIPLYLVPLNAQPGMESLVEYLRKNLNFFFNEGGFLWSGFPLPSMPIVFIASHVGFEPTNSIFWVCTPNHHFMTPHTTTERKIKYI